VIYLSVPPNAERIGRYQEIGLGVMLTPVMGNGATAGLTWAADTGCFKNPDGFELGRYLARLERWTDQAGPGLFATAPDVVCDPEETWRRSKPILPVLRDHGYIAALVAQDGLEDPDWDAFDCLFVGGSTEWKLSEATYRLAAEAKERGKWVHMGRVNSETRFAAAEDSGAYHSADGTFVGFAPDVNLPKVARWLSRRQASLWEAPAC
jgi:hypothetical protein